MINYFGKVSERVNCKIFQDAHREYWLFEEVIFAGSEICYPLSSIVL